jgi:hypothetical protein
MITVVSRIWSETKDGKELGYVNDWPQGIRPEGVTQVTHLGQGG